MKYYLPFKKHEKMELVSKWMDLETIILGEIALTQKDQCHLFALISDC